MKIFNFKDMIGGWFVGDFEPSAYKTKDFEVAYKFHPKGEKRDAHYHKKASEINFLLRGKFKFNDTIIDAGSVFIIEPYHVVEPEFLEDCEFVVIKTVSDKNDKYIVEEKHDI